MTLPLAQLILSSTLLVPLAASATPKYQLTTFGKDGTTATAINNRGDIIGTFSYNQGMNIESFLIKDGNIQRSALGTVEGLNDHGDIVGSSGWWDDPYRPASIYKNGRTINIPSIDRETEPTERVYGAAKAINNSGAAVGYIYTTNDLSPNWGIKRAFLYENGTSKAIGIDPNQESYATDINNHGLAVGYGWNGKTSTAAFIYDGISTREIGSFGGTESMAYSINDYGAVAGYGTTKSGSRHAFIYENGILTDLGTFGQTSSVAKKINNRGQVLITAYSDNNTASYYLYERGVIHNLSDLIAPDPEWRIAAITDINDTGQILGTACDTDRACVGLLLNPLAPVPEPATWGMLLGGGALLALIRRGDRRRKLLPVLAASMLALPMAADAAPKFKATALGLSFDATTFAINDMGVIAGSTGRPWDYKAVVWSDGKVQNIGTVGGFSAQAMALNNKGTIVGQSMIWDGTLRAFQRKDGMMTALPTLRGVSTAYAINEKDVIVGESGIDRLDEGTRHAVIWSNGTIKDLGTLGGTQSTARSINEAGSVVGYSSLKDGTHHAFIYDNGTMRDLGVLAVGGSSFAWDINDSGQIIGESYDANGRLTAFTYRNGQMQALSPFGSAQSRARAINNQGNIVGSYFTKQGGWNSFVTLGGTAYDLNTLLDPIPGFTLNGIEDINDQNQIVAYGCSSSGWGQCNVFRLDLLPAVPEPASWGLMLWGLAFLGIAVRRHKLG